MLTEKAPYIVTVFIAALAWTVTHFVNRIVDSPTIEYKIIKTQVQGNTYDYVVRITNLSSTSTFHNPEFTVIARGNAKLEFSKEHTTVRATPPANAANAAAVNQADAVSFMIPVLPPKAEFELMTRFKGDGNAIFMGRPAQGGADSFLLVEVSLQTLLARYEFWIFGIGLLIWAGILLLWSNAPKENK
jgi:hypothetical protein